jgi:hypothetical protein
MRRAIAAVFASVIGACLSSSASTDVPDAATPDGSIDAPAEAPGASCPAPVSGKCTQEGATACGIEATCGDVGGSLEVTCTCRNGIWDCRKCRDCTPGMALCGNTEACQGGTATRCDGVTVKVVQCNCGYFAHGNGWVCTDFDGNTFSTYCDAGADADADAD